MHHGVGQMLLREIADQQDVVNRVLDGGQIVNPHTRPRHHLWAVVGDEQRQTDAIAQILEVSYRWYIRRLQTRTL